MKNNDLILFENPHFIVDMMYARRNNMVGRAVYVEIGFGNKAYVHKKVAEKLLSIVPVLEEKNYKMRICDAYRPPLAHSKLLEIIPRAGFFAANPERSNHCHGTAVDVCLTDIDGNNLDYPTQIDAYEEKYSRQVAAGNFDEFFNHLKKARHDYTEASDLQIKNREFLKNLMETHGFSSIEHEWWHYNIADFALYPLAEWKNGEFF
ncbi:MAG: D-alanyl-D-alanine carboxypeptidase family protein [Alphaproteobacteria bacterium]|nr:D-alanyl-D-alanine carboxypeptidase family protein [Alphaproteobacteria bacterium]